MHVSQITELYSSSQFPESLILRQIFNFNGDSYLLAGKIRKGMDALHCRVINHTPSNCQKAHRVPPRSQRLHACLESWHVGRALSCFQMFRKGRTEQKLFMALFFLIQPNYTLVFWGEQKLKNPKTEPLTKFMYVFGARIEELQKSSLPQRFHGTEA